MPGQAMRNEGFPGRAGARPALRSQGVPMEQPPVVDEGLSWTGSFRPGKYFVRNSAGSMDVLMVALQRFDARPARPVFRDADG
jgi:hypothetical protein